MAISNYKSKKIPYAKAHASRPGGCQWACLSIIGPHVSRKILEVFVAKTTLVVLLVHMFVTRRGVGMRRRKGFHSSFVLFCFVLSCVRLRKLAHEAEKEDRVEKNR